MLMLFLYIVGYSIISIPKDIAENVGTEGWITLLILTSYIVFNGCILIYLGNLRKNTTIYEYSKLIAGRFISPIIVGFYIMYFAYLSITLVRLAGEYIKLEMLPNTPIWAICLMLSLVAFYAVTKKLRVIGRLAEIFGPIIIIVFFTVLCLVFSKGKLINIRPLYGSLDAMTHLKALINPAIIVGFIGAEPLTFIPLDEKNKKKTYIYVSIGMMLVGFFHILATESCISLIGIDDVIRYNDPLVFVIRRIDLPSIDFLQRIDGFFFIAWIISMFYILCCTMYGTTVYLSKWLKKTNFTLIAFSVFLVSFLIALIPPSFELSLKLVSNGIAYLGLIAGFLIPVILFAIAKVKKYG
jgi:spore germination protein (amino acid permease)